MNPEDREKILQRDPQVDERLLFGGSDVVTEAGRHSWEKKFAIAFSAPLRPGELEVAYGRGMLKKTDLRDGQYYWGLARNARVARWSAADQKFYHKRWKAGHWRTESLEHPIDQVVYHFCGQVGAFDIFIPWLEVTPRGYEIID